MFLRQVIARILLDLAETGDHWAGNEDELVDHINQQIDGNKQTRELIRQMLFTPAIQRECKRLGISFSWCEMPLDEENRNAQ